MNPEPTIKVAHEWPFQSARRLRRPLGLLVLAGLATTITWKALQVTPFEGYYPFLIIQLLFAFGFAGWIAIVISVTASGLRRLAWGWRGGSETRPWQWFSLEGAVVGSLAAGIWLTAAPRDTYISPSGREQLEFRLPSLIEGPLGLHPCSDIFVPVRVTYTDAQGRRIVRHATDSKERTAAMRVLARQVKWSTDTPGRVEVILPEPGLRLLFPGQDQLPPGEISDGVGDLALQNGEGRDDSR